MCEQQLLSLKGYSKQLLKLKRTQTTLEQELADDSAVGNGGGGAGGGGGGASAGGGSSHCPSVDSSAVEFQSRVTQQQSHQQQQPKKVQSPSKRSRSMSSSDPVPTLQPLPPPSLDSNKRPRQELPAQISPSVSPWPPPQPPQLPETEALPSTKFLQPTPQRSRQQTPMQPTSQQHALPLQQSTSASPHFPASHTTPRYRTPSRKEPESSDLVDLTQDSD